MVTIQTNATLAIHEEWWEIFHLDIKTTFLNGDLQEDMFMEWLEGQETKVCDLWKDFYELKHI